MSDSQAAAAIGASWLLLGLLFLGIGCLFERALVPALRSNGVTRFWMGWLASVSLLQLWHLVLPVNGWVYLVLVPSSAVGWLVWLRRRSTVALTWRPGWAGVAFLALACLAGVARRALEAPGNPDACLYFLQKIQWIKSYRIVPGLGNLIIQLGFQHAYYLYSGLLDAGPFNHQAQHLANGLLFLSVTASGLVGIRGLLSHKSPPKGSDVYWATAGALSLERLLGGDLSSASADAAVWCLNVVLPGIAFQPQLDGDQPEPDRIKLVAALAICAVIVKSTAVFVAAGLLVWAISQWLSSRQAFGVFVRWLAASAALICLPWMASGWVENGYPSFPYTWGDLHLPWRVPEGVALRERIYEVAFAHFRGTADRGAWVAHWLSIEWLDDWSFTVPLLLISLTLMGAVLLKARSPNSGNVPKAALLSIILALALWWSVAPDPRFINPLPWTLESLLLLAVLSRLGAVAAKAARSLSVVWVALVAAGACVGVHVLFPGSTWRTPTEEESGARGTRDGEIVQGRTCCVDPPCAFHVEHTRERRAGDPGAGFESDLLGP